MTPSPRAPKSEGLNAEFYAHVSDGTLRVQRCTECGEARHPPRYRCGVCGSPAYEWAAVSGRGTLFTFAVTHLPYDKGWASEVPYTTVVVELEQGVRLIGATSETDLAIGEAMVASLEPREEGFTLITFGRG